MASYTTAFSLSREVLNEIEQRRGTIARSWFVDKVLREAFGMPAIIKGKQKTEEEPASTCQD